MKVLIDVSVKVVQWLEGKFPLVKKGVGGAGWSGRGKPGTILPKSICMHALQIPICVRHLL